MNSYELDIIDEKSQAGSAFMDRVAKELRRALMAEKASRKITQQYLAEQIGTSRAVVNREVQGLENLTSRRIGELFWALGWEPFFEARKPPVGDNNFVSKDRIKQASEPSRSATSSSQEASRVVVKRAPEGVKITVDASLTAQ
ncbi:hypothetical protein ACQR1H_03270 [Bradyrhizobium sp. HKCCYLRH2015]|uniref:hypothetical protein n=1 Tax=Bradyrhizobium sp. HKCCYLRH2015 TaxID=3420742 RepID=UPI003EC08267